MAKEKPALTVKNSRAFSLKYGETMFVPLEKFGFVPEVIVIQRLSGSRFTVGAILPENDINTNTTKA